MGIIAQNSVPDNCILNRPSISNKFYVYLANSAYACCDLFSSNL